jgi:hypothetical protein
VIVDRADVQVENPKVGGPIRPVLFVASAFVRIEPPRQVQELTAWADRVGLRDYTSTPILVKGASGASAGWGFTPPGGDGLDVVFQQDRLEARFEFRWSEPGQLEFDDFVKRAVDLLQPILRDAKTPSTRAALIHNFFTPAMTDEALRALGQRLVLVPTPLSKHASDEWISRVVLKPTGTQVPMINAVMELRAGRFEIHERDPSGDIFDTVYRGVSVMFDVNSAVADPPPTLDATQWASTISELASLEAGLRLSGKREGLW